jgi:hypothetical protein
MYIYIYIYIYMYIYIYIYMYIYIYIYVYIYDSSKTPGKLIVNIGDISDYSPSVDQGGCLGNVLSIPQALQLVIGKTIFVRFHSKKEYT